MFTVFSLHEPKTDKMRYIGITQQEVSVRVSSIVSQSRSKSSPGYDTGVSEWLRGVSKMFHAPGYKVHGSFNSAEEANALKYELSLKNTELVNERAPRAVKFKRLL